MKNVCVYCGSTLGNDPAYLEAARSLGVELAQQGKTLVYGGVGMGLMGAVAEGALAAGGKVIGIIPQTLLSMEIAHPHLTELHIVADMHERKRTMADLADGFMVLPGGSGTMDEFFEIFTWAQLGFHHKPIGILNVNGFYRALHGLIDALVAAGFVRQEHADMLQDAPTPALLLEKMLAYAPTYRPKWDKGL